MRYLMCFFILLFSLIGCQQKSTILYQSKEFTVYSNKVIQGNNEAKIISSHEIVSNYQSKVHENYSRLITFKFSINEKDNEKRSLADHWLIIGDEHASPVIVFGSENSPTPAAPGPKLPANYSYTFRLDMRPVLEQFKANGYYACYDGTRVAASDFKSVCIAGGSEPLSWDFVNLEEKGLDLKDPDGDGIYEITLVLNPFDPANQKAKSWTPTVDVSDKPVYSSDQPIVDALFNLSLEEAKLNIESDSTLRTGKEWGGVWTRDVSYSILLAFAYHEPEVAKISLLKKVKRGRIIQDTGSGGAWPVSSDRLTWALGAWELYKVTGDKQWLQTAYSVIKNSLDDDYKTIRSAQTGMNRGESSFLDWREQTYPKWMSNKDIYVSENLGTNVVHYQANRILVEMAKLLGEPFIDYQQRAEEIKKAINQYLWMEDKGYYGQYLYGRSSLILSPRFEALGEALAVLFDVADSGRAVSIIGNSPLTTFGTTCVYPQTPGIPPYHNNAIWPFVQSYWNLAAAKTGNETVLQHGLAAIYRAGALFLTNYENMVADNGDYVGTEINSSRMLWSMAGNLAMVHRLFIGLHFEPEGIRFQPVIPSNYSGNKSLENFHYRNCTLDIKVSGHGNKISSITLDDSPLKDAFLPASTVGKHVVKIEMNNNNMEGPINLVDNHFVLETPIVKLDNATLRWPEIKGAQHYIVYENGQKIAEVTSPELQVKTSAFYEYMVTAIDGLGYESFANEPVVVFPEQAEKIVETESMMKKSLLPYTNYSGDGFIKISTTENRKLAFNISVKEKGRYLIDLRYANGTGPWNTDNNCAIRSVYINNTYQGVFVMPQRGTDEWSDWGFTNAIEVELEKGTNTLTLQFDSWNTNMDGDINEALIDYIRLIQIEHN